MHIITCDEKETSYMVVILLMIIIKFIVRQIFHVNKKLF